MKEILKDIKEKVGRYQFIKYAGWLTNNQPDLPLTFTYDNFDQTPIIMAFKFFFIFKRDSQLTEDLYS